MGNYKRGNGSGYLVTQSYGAGVQKLGTIVGAGSKEGSILKKRFLDKTPALKQLIDKVKKYSEKHGYLPGLDGRRIPVRSAHSALNSLLQCDGALIAKQSLVNLKYYLRQEKLTLEQVKLVAWSHDEFQLECDEGVSDKVGELCVKAFEQAGVYFDFRIPITGEYKVGDTWKETH